MRPFLFALSILALTTIAAPARAQTEHYKFDTVHSQIIFYVNHLGFSTSEGEFLDFDGSLEFNHDDPAASKVDVTIDTNSLSMDDETWNEHLKGKNFFDVAQFPKMTFKSTSIKVTGEKTADITGDLTLLGVTKSVTLKTVYNKSGNHPFTGKYISGFSATTSVKRSDFGMNYGLPGIGDDVEIRIEVEAIRADDTDKETSSDKE